MLFLLVYVSKNLLRIWYEAIDQSFWVRLVAGDDSKGPAIIANSFVMRFDEIAFPAVQSQYLVTVFLSEVDEPE